jgi:poly(3-hydroxybutyrate) depolymerase
MPMKKIARLILFVLLINIVGACATADSSPTLLYPGDKIGEMTLSARQAESVEFSIFSYCDPFLAETDPPVVVKECQVPRLTYLVIGYGEYAGTQEELDASWQSKSWELYVDGKQVDLSAFGTFDVDLGEKVRAWKVTLENLSPGVHNLRYIIRSLDGESEPDDVTWKFTVADEDIVDLSTPTPAPVSYPALTSAINPGQHEYTSEKAQFNFLLYLPLDYGKEPQKKWPLILFLHGSDLSGNDLNRLKIGELSGVLEYADDFPAIVVSPQLSGEGERQIWFQDEPTNALFTLLDEIQATYSVDPKRIYLTGSSLGGGGTWTIGLRYPDKFAALVPVMGFHGYPFDIPGNICDLKDVPIWAFHGVNDEFVPLDAEAGLVDALRACGSDIKFTVYEDAGHDIAQRVYLNPSLYMWLFSQTLE